MDSMYSKSKWIDSPQQEKLLEMFFVGSPIQIDWDFHGTQKVHDDKILIFGPWAGPHQCITHLIHEMGHLVEIDDARILKYGWGLTTPEIYIPGRYSHMASVPVTYQPSLRECRVMALQWQVQCMLGIEETPRELLSSLKFMPDWCNVPRGNSSYEKDGLNGVDDARMILLENKMLQYSRDKYTLSFFMEEWKRKNNLLREALKQ